MHIRPFSTTEEYRACVALQEATWGEGFSECVSPAILKVSQILGGVAAGAYEGDRLVGFVFGMTGVRDGEVVHWSDMLAVRQGLRDAGLGLRLKAYQREDVMTRGVEKMFWTFDPLQSRNAHLNLTKLGAVVREYVENMYGDTDSPLHRGIGTDRFVALWLLGSARVRDRLARSLARAGGVTDDGARAERGSTAADGALPTSPPLGVDAPMALPSLEGDRHPAPGEPDLTLDTPAVRVAIPSDIGTLMADDLNLAVTWRTATRAVLAHYMRIGYEVREIERRGRVSTYVLVDTNEANPNSEARSG